MSQSNMNSQVYLAAVLRSSDKTVVASYQNEKDVTVEGVRECIAANSNIASGKRYTSQGSNQSIHYFVDSTGKVYAIVTSPKYSSRIAFGAIEELKEKFGAEFGPRAATAKEGSLSRLALPILKSLCQKYGDPGNVDKLASVQGKIDVVKSTMQENIQQLLANTEKMENIEQASLHLSNQAEHFKDGSKALRDKMWWKMWKMRLLIGGLITCVLIIIIVPLAVTTSSTSSSSKK